MADTQQYIRQLDELNSEDADSVGGKNASLGEMLQSLEQQGIRVPAGFATTAQAYREFLERNELTEAIRAELEAVGDTSESLQKAGRHVRRLINKAAFPEPLRNAVGDAYRGLCEAYDSDEVDVAVRSSATAEDLPEASFAGQQETFLNVGGIDELIDACRRCYASLFTDRAISYRNEQQFDHMKVALSVGVQKMVRSDEAGSGVMFSLDTETGFRDVVVINAAWGLGETVVQGSVNPDEYVVFKPLLDKRTLRPIVDKTIGEKAKKMVYAKGGSKATKNVETSKKEQNSFVLSDDEILTLARWAVAIEKHYEKPMDMEWAKDGKTGELFIVQARPETVQSQKEASTLKTYRLVDRGEELIRGLAIGQAIATGKAQVIESAEQMDAFEDDAILVTGMTDPDWVPVMKRAAGIITDHGGRTSHAAIVSRELGIAAVVGAGDATRRIQDGQEITLSCTEGDEGVIYDGSLEYDEQEIDLRSVPDVGTEIMMNIASPAAAFRWWRLPVRGVGLARMEFIINNRIKIHPLALSRFDEIEDRAIRRQIEQMTAGYSDRTQYFVDHLSRGIARIAASQYPRPAIVRMSDFKTNEYGNLIGGVAFEPDEENPMLGFRGASRYYSDRYRDGFALECAAIRRVREEMGLRNVVMMIPFCRTVEEADRILDVLADNDLERGKNALEVYVMCEIPSNVVQADEFSHRFDGFSIGTNDLTQLLLGVDRDSDELSHLFDERNPTVKRMVEQLIATAHENGCKVGICGQAPSDHPEYAQFLVRAGIDSISLNPDSVIDVIQNVAEIESKTAV
jgi:pyruvate,water dikinase